MIQVISGFVSKEMCDALVHQALYMEKRFYNDELLKDHRVYFQDITPGRKSSAYAIAEDYKGSIPTISLGRHSYGLAEIHKVTSKVRKLLELGNHARILFNVQEYYSNSEAVPRHFDGELLDFYRDGEKLTISEAIRPEKVAVLTLINDVAYGGGTRLHSKKGSNVAVCNPGDLLIFDNINLEHSVDAFVGQATREDGRLRMIIGWRSISQNCRLYSKEKGVSPWADTRTVNNRISLHLETYWPLIYRDHMRGKSAAF